MLQLDNEQIKLGHYQLLGTLVILETVCTLGRVRPCPT